jgi:hypothetical protein
MNEYLLRYAIDNVWCNPGQDRQFVYKLQQLTPRYGTRRYYTVDAERYEFPYDSDREWFHMYQIGQVVPQLLGLPKIYNKWISLESLANNHKMLGEVYVDSGIQFPRAQTWVLLTTNQNLLVAVKLLDRFPDLDEHQPYLHFYQNAFYQSKRSDESTRHFIDARSILPKTTGELRQFQIKIMDDLETLKGIPLCWVNGRLVQEISLVTADVGDYCEWVLDSSIYRTEKFKLSALPTFTSTLDKQTKYILHTPKAIHVDSISYYDDVAVFLSKEDEVLSRFSGVYYHHNDGRWMRNLTHRDFSVQTARCQTLIAEHPEDPRGGLGGRFPLDKWSANDPMYLQLYYRRSGYERPLVADSHRIQELYRLKDKDIITAMTGPSSIPIWQAANLENAPYVQFMSAPPKDIYPIAFNIPTVTNQAKVEAQNWAGDVFGYHEAAHLMANNPTIVTVLQDQLVADLPYCYWENVTVFEYNKKGELLEYHHQVQGSRYYPRNNACYMVECVTGKGSINLEGVYGVEPVPLPGGYDFRVYVNKVFAGTPTGEWIDITELPNRHEWGFLDKTGDVPVFRWTVKATAWQGCIRQSSNFFLEERRFSRRDGIIRFSFRNESMSSGQLTSELMDIPFGQLDIMVRADGKPARSLVGGVDYVIIEGKRFQDTVVVINNLEYLGEVSDFIIRGTGFCSSDLHLWPATETGFVEYNVLSGNGVYDIHTHKMQRIIIDGHYRPATELHFDEDFGDLIIGDERNGAPYQIQTPQVTFRDVYEDTDEKARIEDDARDKMVSDFMTEYFPPRPRLNVDLIKDRYNVFSVYTNKLLTDILRGIVKPPFVNGRMSDMDILNAIKPYEWLKPFDMLNRTYNVNHIYVYPHWYPEPQGLDQQQYEFFTRALKMSLQVMPELSPFIYMTRT